MAESSTCHRFTSYVMDTIDEGDVRWTMGGVRMGDLIVLFVLCNG